MKLRKKQFEIPNDGETVNRLLESIPEDWTWINGGLSAPENLAKSGEVLKGIVLVLHHGLNDGQPIIYKGKDPVRIPGPSEIMAEGSMPEGVLFNEAGSGFFAFRFVKSIATGFVNRGYDGELTFFSDYVDPEGRHRNPAACVLTLQAWLERGKRDGVFHGRGVELTWCDDGESVAAILAACTGLREYEYQKMKMPVIVQ